MKESSSKTRKVLVDTARRLFAQNGIENTTMNNIALVSGKGRRTLYTYFGNKTEIYQAVIESELEHLLLRLKEIIARDLPPNEKLTAYIQTRFDVLRETVLRNGTLKAEFFRDTRKVEAARKNIDKQELGFLQRIIAEGIDKGVFRVTHIPATSLVIQCCLRGLEVPYLRGAFQDMGFDAGKMKEYISDLTLTCLGG